MEKLQTALVVFDMDGVLLDSEPIHALVEREIVESLGLKAFDPVKYTGSSVLNLWAQVLKDNGAAGDPVRLRALHYEKCLDYVLAQGLGPSQGLMELLDWLEARGVLLGLASSSERPFVDGVLEALGLRGRFRFSAAGSEAARQKPDPELYQRVLAQAGIPARHAAAIEDSRTGVRAAKGAGLFCVGYKNPTSGAQDLAAADCLVESLREVPRWIK